MSIRVHGIVGVGEAKQRIIVLLGVVIGIGLRLPTHQGTTIVRVHDSVVGKALNWGEIRQILRPKSG